MSRLLLTGLAATVLSNGLTSYASAAPVSRAVTSGANAPTGATVAAKKFEVLQMNLCRSGKAKCFNKGDQSPRPTALKWVKQSKPNIVTLNEVCLPEVQGMVKDLKGAYTMTWKSVGSKVGSSIKAYQCVDPKTGKGRGSYGIAILARTDGSVGATKKIRRGLYPEKVQETGTRERRAYLCVQFTRVNACTTHLATKASKALAQCRRMKNTLADLRKDKATVFGGDLNLKFKSGDYNVQKCVPSGFFRKGFKYSNGKPEVNHIMASTSHFTFDRSTPYYIPGTDHKAFTVESFSK